MTEHAKHETAGREHARKMIEARRAHIPTTGIVAYVTWITNATDYMVNAHRPPTPQLAAFHGGILSEYLAERDHAVSAKVGIATAYTVECVECGEPATESVYCAACAAQIWADVRRQEA